MTFLDAMTLGDARDELRELVVGGDGAICPCCNQLARIYRWSLYSTAARALILYYRLGRAGTEYVHANELKRHGHQGHGDASRLRHWGLAVQESERREDGGRSGWWCCTERGRRFVLGVERIPKYAHVYDGRCLGLHGEPVAIRDCLGERFDYDQLMAA